MKAETERNVNVYHLEYRFLWEFSGGVLGVIDLWGLVSPFVISFCLFDTGLFKQLNLLVGLCLVILGLVLELWAVIHIKSGRHLSWETGDDVTKVVTTGPYKYIRHPWYLADLLIMLGTVVGLNHLPEILNVCMWIIAVLTPIAVLGRILIEEPWLKKEVPGYREYVSKTKRFIPYLV